ncbi:hypothetical protein ACH4Q7_22450 [Streptomyces roseolus]|uniref:hypothetical protein n=1 Tax=Streptomyces roseolus TaxID=67358 RepID=UPI0037B59639
MTTRVFTVAELAALGVPPHSPEDIEYDENVLADNPVSMGKYDQNRMCVFRADDGHTYAVTYAAPIDAGDYEVGPGPDNHGWYGDTVEAVRVRTRWIVTQQWTEDTDDAPAEPTAAEARMALYSALMWPSWNPVSESHGTGADRADALLDAYRNALVRDVHLEVTVDGDDA